MAGKPFPPRAMASAKAGPPSTAKQSVGRAPPGPQELQQAMKEQAMRKKASSGPMMAGPAFVKQP